MNKQDILNYVNKEMSQATAKNFKYYIQEKMDEKNIRFQKDVYIKAGITSQTFSKILNVRDYNTSKLMVNKIAIGLRLNEEEYHEFLSLANYGYNKNSIEDVVFLLFIKRGVYDIFEIEDAIIECYYEKALKKAEMTARIHGKNLLDARNSVDRDAIARSVGF